MFPDLGSTQQQAALIVGFFLPLILAIPIQGHWPDSLRTLFSVAAYAAAGAITAAAAGKLTGQTFWQSTLEILALGVIGYKGVWQPSGLAPAIESRTNVNPATPPAQPSPGLEPHLASLLGAGARLLDQMAHRVGTVTTERAESGSTTDGSFSDAHPGEMVSPEGQIPLADEATNAAPPDERKSEATEEQAVAIAAPRTDGRGDSQPSPSDASWVSPGGA